MLEFVISNYIIFIVIAIVLMLGLFGYMMDRKKYEQYRDEIVNQDKVYEALEAAPDVVNAVASPISMEASVNNPGPVVVDTPVQTVTIPSNIEGTSAVEETPNGLENVPVMDNPEGNVVQENQVQ